MKSTSYGVGNQIADNLLDLVRVDVHIQSLLSLSRWVVGEETSLLLYSTIGDTVTALHS
jgi:hypothetical protein